VLFLVLNQRGEGVVVGMVQGKFKVATDASGEKVVHNIFHGTPPEQSVNEKAKVQRLSLTELKRRVKGDRP
jgi:hypothetical protein